jgi:carboxyl-terminal processing protease
VTRAEFDLPIVTSETLEDDVGYINLLQFVEGAGERVREEVAAMVDDGVAGIVLDLRENPGGLLNEAVAVSSVFIEDGNIVTVEERSREREVFEAVGDAYEQVPLVVLVDDHSASASEIVAGAIQDADRGTIVGEQTFGKGTVQTITQLSDGSGAKFTTARYYTPSGDSIEGVGVKPDVEVAAGDNGRVLEDDPQVRAAVDEIVESVDEER